ncbi:MAG: hypothetical protein AABX89_01680 [Candidatus Thermoplasmatota archaeon]
MAKLILAMLALAGLALAGCIGETPASTVTKTVTNQATAPTQGALHSQLHALYADTPYLNAAGTAPVATPAHEWLTLGDGNLAYLHWDNDDPMKATKLAFYGDALGPLKGCKGDGGISQAQIDAGFSHFHKLKADSFAAGHGPILGAPATTGYWLRHTDAMSGQFTHIPGLDNRGVVEAC